MNECLEWMHFSLCDGEYCIVGSVDACDGDLEGFEVRCLGKGVQVGDLGGLTWFERFEMIKGIRDAVRAWRWSLQIYQA